MRILVILSAVPYPPKMGSDIIAYNNIRTLAACHHVEVVCNGPQDASVIQEKFQNSTFHFPKVAVKANSLLLHVLRNLISGLPTLVYHAKWVAPMVRELDQSERYDAILSYGFSTILDCPPELRYKLIANIEDPQSLKLKRMRELSNCSLWDKMKLTIHLLFLKQFENKIFPAIGKIALLSETDISDVREKGKLNNLCFVPYGVENREDSLIRRMSDRERGMIVISGNMNHLPNVEGVLYFISEIFPLILKKYPLAKLWIVGADPRESIKKAAMCFPGSMVVTGRVNSVSDYIRKAMVCVCPVRLKIGVQTKILEALSFGTPVVTTPEGNSGVQAIVDRDLCVQDRPDDFADQVVQLLNGHKWDCFSDNGLRFVRTHFSWERSATNLEGAILSLKKSMRQPLSV